MLKRLLTIPLVIIVAISIGITNPNAEMGTTTGHSYSEEAPTYDREAESTVVPEPCDIDNDGNSDS